MTCNCGESLVKPEEIAAEECTLCHNYVQLAKDTLGSAVRDNTREQLIAIGKDIDENGADAYDR